MHRRPTTTLSEWAFDAALCISEERCDRFQNRFTNKRLRQIHSPEAYVVHSESIMGYMGDVGAAAFLGLDPAQMLSTMIEATDGLAHRDEADLFVNGRNVDVKVEDYDRWHSAVLEGRITPRQPYGCRLINLEQWEENAAGTDAYLFGVFDPALGPDNRLHQAQRLAWIGCISAERVATMPAGTTTPAGVTLPVPAIMIPNNQLSPPDAIVASRAGTRRPPRQKAPDHARLKRIRFLQDQLEKIVRETG